MTAPAVTLVTRTPHQVYGAPLGWWTPMDDPRENTVWILPNGLTVPGSAPLVFTAFQEEGYLDPTDPQVTALAQRYPDLQGTIATPQLDGGVQTAPQTLPTVVVIGNQSHAILFLVLLGFALFLSQKKQ